MKKAFSRFVSVISWIIVSVLVLLSLFNIILALQRKFANKVQPTVLGFSTAIISTGSMSGTIEVNDFILIHTQKNYEIGDIVTYEGNTSSVTHRIVDITDDGFVTKGDANNAADIAPVSPDRVVGKVILVMPKFGRIIVYLQTPLGMLTTIAAAILIIEIPTLIERKKSKEKGASGSEKGVKGK